MYCPKDFKPCCDDLCHGVQRCFDIDEPMLVPCPGCKNLVAVDGSDNDLCTCDPDDFDPCDESGNYPEV